LRPFLPAEVEVLPLKGEVEEPIPTMTNPAQVATKLPMPVRIPDPQPQFWRRKAMSEMTSAEWESLCDGCGRCCLNKLIEEDTNDTLFTDVSCKLLDCAACRCRDYSHRHARVKDCVRLTPRNVRRLKWLPPTCGYRLVAEGKDLAWWHPLVSGDPETVHQAGISVRGRVSASETDVPDEKLAEHIVSWPGKWPKGAKRKGKRKRHRPRGAIAKS